MTYIQLTSPVNPFVLLSAFSPYSFTLFYSSLFKQCTILLRMQIEVPKNRDSSPKKIFFPVSLFLLPSTWPKFCVVWSRTLCCWVKQCSFEYSNMQLNINCFFWKSVAAPLDSDDGYLREALFQINILETGVWGWGSFDWI